VSAQLNDALAGRLSFAINRLENLLKQKRPLLERLRHAASSRTNSEKVRDGFTREADQLDAEILQIQAAIHDIRFVRENA
jgi:flagellar biosynthesis/type III secretory pathway chaperone